MNAGSEPAGRSNVHIRHDLPVAASRRWPHPHTPIVPPSSAAAGAARPTTPLPPSHSSTVVVRMTNIRPRGRLERLRRVGETSSSSPSPSPSSSSRRRVTRSGCVGRCAGVGAARARRRRFRHRRRGEHVEDVQRRWSSRRPPRRPSSVAAKDDDAGDRTGRGRRDRDRGRGVRHSTRADAGEDRGGPSDDRIPRRRRATRSGRRLRDRRVADDDGGRRAATNDDDGGARRRRRRRPAGRGGHPRGGAGRASEFRAHRGRVVSRATTPPTRSPGRSGWMGPSSWGGGDGGASRRDGGRCSSTIEDRSSAPRRPRVRRRPGRRARRSTRPLRECYRARGPAARVRRRPPRGPASRSRGGECHSPTTADRLSVAVRRHPRSPLDQLLEERLEERLAEDHIVSRRRSRCFA